MRPGYVPKAAVLAVMLVLCSTMTFAQGAPVPLNAPASPAFSTRGIVMTDQTGDALYRLTDTGIEVILRSPGCGRYFSLDSEGMRVGVKFIDGEGLQVPAILDAGSVLPLASPARRAGQVSFSSGGAIAFTIDNLLIVRDNRGDRTFDLGFYANLAPLSPDGKCVAFNDSEDRIWKMDLGSGVKTQLSPEQSGYFGPQWSPDSRRLFFSRLDGQGVVLDLVSKKLFSLGETLSPSWAPDGQTLVFYRTEVQNGQLRNTDLYACRYDGSDLLRLTNTPDVCEMDPALSSDGGTLLYHTYERATICTQPFSPAGVSVTARRNEIPVRLSPTLRGDQTLPRGSAQLLDVPYVNQVYDTADWFNGHAACGPTTAIMLLAYYNLLPEWDLRCSWPSSHVTHWGQYVSERYFFRQTDYAFAANDPNGRPANGGYGYMWSGTSSPYSTMASYYAKHGLSAVCRDSSALPHSNVVAELSAGPLSVCNGLTTAGHIVLAHGLGDESHTFVVNDPYGDKNRTDLGYPNTAGKNARYDWPGYNNGYKNFNRIYWHVSAVYAPPVERDTLVDDVDFQQGFSIAIQPPAGFPAWKDLNRGFRGHMWWTKTKTGPDTCYAIWTPILPADGFYELFAYIAFSNATSAEYKINSLDGVQTFVLDQKVLKDTWASLGTFRFPAGAGGKVRLGDQSAIAGQELVFDAIRWSYQGPLPGVRASQPEGLPRKLALTNYPNPFNPVTRLRFALPGPAMVRLEIVNLLGQRVGVPFEGWLGPGDHEVPWDATGCSTGMYLARLRTVGGDGRTVSTVTRGILLAR